MNGKDIELTRRRVLGGAATIGAASAAAGAGTFAYFSDTESSTGNTVDAGTLNITTPVDGQITLSNGVPGSTFTGTISTTYDSNSDVNPAEFDLSASLADSSTEQAESNAGTNTELTGTEFARNLQITSATVDITNTGGTTTTDDLLSGDTPGAPFNNPVNASDDGTTDDNPGADFVDLVELANAMSVDNYASLAPGYTVDVNISGKIDEQTANDAQADGVTLTVGFAAQQSNKD